MSDHPADPYHGDDDYVVVGGDALSDGGASYDEDYEVDQRDRSFDEWIISGANVTHSSQGLFAAQANPGRAAPSQLAWSSIRLGDCILDVCSSGGVRKRNAPFQHIDYGVQYPGTIYSVVRIEVSGGEHRNFLVHELVWRAFNGDIPDGWDVRHKQDALHDLTPGRTVSNALELLDIFPSTATYLTNANLRNL